MTGPHEIGQEESDRLRSIAKPQVFQQMTPPHEPRSSQRKEAHLYRYFGSTTLASIFHNMINGPSLTPCFSWVFGKHDDQNRFNDFLQSAETVETVRAFTRSPITQLKQGVNETAAHSRRRRCKIPTLALVLSLSISPKLLAIEPSDILVYSKEPFLLRPQVAISESYNDNIFSRPNSTGDFVTTISPSLNFQLGKSQGNLLAFGYRFDQHFYAKRDDLNSGEHSFDFRARFQKSRFGITGNDQIQLLSSPIGLVEVFSPAPTGVNQIPTPTTGVGQQPGTGAGETQPPLQGPDSSVSPVRGGEVVTLEERSVDRLVHYHNYNIGYGLTEKTGLYLQGLFTETDYEGGIGLFDLNTFRLTGGIAFQAFPKISFLGETYYGQTATEPNAPGTLKNPHLDFIGGSLGVRGIFTEKLSGTVKVGYESREFSDGSEAPSSPVVDFGLFYRMSEKTALSLSYARLHDVSIQFSTGGHPESYTANVLNAQISQALSRSGKLVGSLGGSYGNYEYQTTAGTASARAYDRYSAFFNLVYRPRLWLTATLGYRYDSVGSESLQGYDVNRMSLSLAIGY